MPKNVMTKEQLMYCTVLINASSGNKSEQGTGFIVENNKGNYFIVTNCHIVNNFDSANFIFCLKNKDTISADSDQNIKVDDLQERIIKPTDDTDACLIFLDDKIGEKSSQGIPLYFQCVPSECFADESKNDISLSPIEDVVMVGYPEGIFDAYNNKPVFRKGITATDIHLDFNNKKEFLIDIAAFNGSSGSPVFLERKNMSIDQNSNKIVINNQYFLIGILKNGFAEENKKCEYEFTEVYNESKVELVFDYMLNLGVVIKSKEILNLLVLSENFEYTKNSGIPSKRDHSQ